MDLTPTTEQLAMADVVRDLVDSWIASPPAHNERWKAVTTIGLDVALTPEAEDGLGLGLSELLPALRALGPVAAHWPWAGTLVTGPAIARALQHETETPVGVAVVPLAGAIRVRHADRVPRVALLARDRSAVVSSEGWQPSEAHDLLGESTWTDVPADLAGLMVPVPNASHVLAAGRVAEAAIQIGVGHRALAIAVEYAGVRQQFGKLIGSFQSIKHLLAEARTALSFADPLVVGAAISVDHGAPLACRDAAVALNAATNAARRAVRASLQAHGGIGYTDELPLGELLTAATHGVQVWGGEARLTREVSEALLADSGHIGTPEHNSLPS